jgi:hypothetical protein
MKRLIVFLSCATLLAACTVQKRHYRKGFYVHAKKSTKNTQQKINSDSLETVKRDSIKRCKTISDSISLVVRNRTNDSIKHYQITTNRQKDSMSYITKSNSKSNITNFKLTLGNRRFYADYGIGINQIPSILISGEINFYGFGLYADAVAIGRGIDSFGGFIDIRINDKNSFKIGISFWGNYRFCYQYIFANNYFIGINALISSHNTYDESHAPYALIPSFMVIAGKNYSP